MIYKIIRAEEVMKLYNAYYICKEVAGILEEPEIEPRKLNSGAYLYKFNNWREIVRSLECLYSIEYLKMDAEALYLEMPTLIREKPSPEVESATKTKIVEKLSVLNTKISVIIDLYESVDNKEKEVGIDVKIPPVNNLGEYIECLKELNFIFTQCPYLIGQDEEIEFRGTDVGSMWLTFAVIGGGFVILNNIAKLIDTAIKIKSHMVTIKQQEEMLASMQQKNEIGSEVLDAFKSMKQQIIQEHTSKLESEMGELKDGEERGKLEKSVEKLAILIDKGVQIYSSIDAPKEVQLLFPEVEDKSLLSSKVMELLEDKSE